MYYSPDSLKDLLHDVESKHGLSVIYGLESGKSSMGL